MSAEDQDDGDWNGFNTKELMDATKELQANKKRQRKPITAAPWFPQDHKTPNNQPRNHRRGKDNDSDQRRKEDKSSDPTRRVLRGGKPNAVFKRKAFSKGGDSRRPDPSPSIRQQNHRRESTWRGPKPNSLISPETIMSAVNRKMEGFANPIQPIIDREDAQSLVSLLSDRRVVNSNGRRVAQRVVNVLDKLCAFLTDQKYRPQLQFKKGDENSEEFWNRAAKEFTARVRPFDTDAKMSGSALCKLIMGFTRLRKEQLATQNGGGTQAPGLVPGLAAPEEEEQVQAGDTTKLERRIQGGIDKWILYLDIENDAAIDLSIFSKLGL